MINFLIPYYHQYPYLATIFDVWRDLLLFLQITIVLFYLFSLKNYKKILIYCLIFFIGFLIATLIKELFPSLRPISVYFPEKIYYDSFPSRHTLTSTIFSFLLIFDNFKLGFFSFALTILIAFFSYFSLMHRLIDIIVGFLLGFLITLIYRKINHIFSKLFIFKREKRNSR
jgi:membrane-associated phospholipid phosphatase